MVHWLGLHSFTAEYVGLTLGRELTSHKLCGVTNKQNEMK